MVAALAIGMVLGPLLPPARLSFGVDLCARSVLRIGVALLGARISLDQIAALGVPTMFGIVVAVAATISFGCIVARLLGCRSDFGVLTAGATAICGASAALAISSVLPRSKERDRSTACTVIGVTVLSTAAMVAYPLLVRCFGLSPTAAGILLGGSIHEVAQVVAAGYGMSPEVGDMAVVVKLFRVALLFPTVLVIAAAFRSAPQAEAAVVSVQPVPLFLVSFLLISMAASFGLVPTAVLELGNEVSRGALLIAVAAVGMKTSVSDLRSFNAATLLVLAAETLFVLGSALAVAELGSR